MTVELLALSLAAIAGVSIIVSATVAALWPVMGYAMGQLTPAAESRVLLAVAALPMFASVLVLAACFSPSLGLATDHCLGHGLYHPHLCLDHVPHVGLTLAVVAMACAIVARAGSAVYRVGRGFWRSRTTEQTLCQVAPPDKDGIRVVPKDFPEAFVLGLLRPKLFASRGLLSMSSYEREVVLAHERAHVVRRDPLRQLAASALLAFHLPWIAGVILRRLQATAEAAADAHAADVVGDGPRVADVLVRLAREHHTRPAHGVGFDGANLEVRVHRLLGPAGHDIFGSKTGCVIICAAVLSAIAFAEPLHHAVEIFLGLLA